MEGKYLSLIIEYARLKTAAVIPEPQENTTFSLFIIPVLANFSLTRFFSIKVLSSGFISSLKGKQDEFSIEPLLTPGLGSFSKPKNLFLFLASTLFLTLLIGVFFLLYKFLFHLLKFCC